MDNASENPRRIENMIRFGTIEEVQAKPPRVRVKSGELETDWLQWFAPRAGDDKEWWAPSVGEQCMVFSPSGDPACGAVLVGLFSEENPPNDDKLERHRTTYSDGAVIEYDKQAHSLKALLPTGATAELVATGGVRIEGDVHIIGAVRVTRDVVAGPGMVSLLMHKHTGVRSGSDTSSIPVDGGPA